jgi:adenylate kinase
MNSNIPVYLVFGPQGSGKSTQAELLSEKLSIPYFDAGNELRRFVETDSDEANIVRSKMQNGQLVSNDILRRLFSQFMETHNCSNGIVADGFPRNITQVELLTELAEQHRWQVIGLFIDISDEIAKERLSKRFSVVDGKKVVRSDDQPAIVEKRLQVFKRETLPVLEYLKQHFTLHDIDGTPSIEEVHKQVLTAING